MVIIELITAIKAPIERCFDLSRCIDAHMASTDWTGERAVAGVTSGLIGLDQQVTWRGRHFGIPIRHTSRISRFEGPNYFQDCMVRGLFRRFCHDHHFESAGELTRMQDHLEFEAPLGWIGRGLERLVLEEHMRSLLQRRNAFIKSVAESDHWKKFLPESG